MDFFTIVAFWKYMAIICYWFYSIFFLKIFPNLLWKKEKEFDVIYYKGKVTFKFFQSKLLFPALNPCRGVRHPLFYQLSLLPPTFLFLFIFNGTSSDLSSIHSWDTFKFLNLCNMFCYPFLLTLFLSIFMWTVKHSKTLTELLVNLEIKKCTVLFWLILVNKVK